MRLLVITIFLFFFSNLSTAQEKWTLEHCIGAALQNNLSVQRADLNVQMAELNYSDSKGDFLPSLSGFARTNLNFGRTIDPFTNTFASEQVRSDAYGLNGNWVLFNGLQKVQSYKQGQFEVMATKYDADKAKNDMSLAVARAFLEIVFNRELKKVAQEQVDLTQKQVIRTEKLVKAGSLPMGNLMDMQAQKAQEELNMVTVSNNLDISTLKLLLLMRMDTLNNFEIDVPEISAEKLGIFKTTPSFVYFKAIETLPEVKSAELRLQSADRGLAAQRGRRSPSLNMNGSVGSGFSGKNPNDFNQQVSDNLNQSLGFSLNFPILNGLNTHTAIQSAKVTQDIRRNEMDQVKYQINEVVKRAYYDAQASRKKYVANTKAVSAMSVSYTYSEKRYELGMMNAVEFNQAKNNMIKAEADLLQAKFDFIFKTMILDFYQGIPLSLRP